MRQNIMTTYKELMAVKATPIESKPIFFEYVSDYRRIVVLGSGSGYEVRTTYKGIAKALKQWSTRWKEKSDAIAWAEKYAANRNIILSGSLTIKEATGKRLI